MVDVNEDKDDKDMNELHRELIAVEADEDEGEAASVEGGESQEGEGKKDGEAEAEAEAAPGDQRASNEAEEDAAAEEQRKKDRESSAARRRRQREARERLERKLAFYERRNEELERRFSGLEENVIQTRRISIQQTIDKVSEQLAEARRIEKLAISDKDGDSAVEARELAEKFEKRLEKLKFEQARTVPSKRQPVVQTEPPPEMRAAFDWIKANKDWYDTSPNSTDEATNIAQAIENAMAAEGRLNPATPAFWRELDRRLQARGIGKRKSGDEVDVDDDVDDEEDDDDNGASHGSHRRASNSNSAGERSDARKPKKGGPKISVGGAARTLKTNEVYVSPERKAAMIEMGIWDDPVEKQKMLRRYQKFDQEAANRGRR